MYIAPGNRLVKRHLTLPESAPVEEIGLKSSSSVHLPLPNPFKALVSLSSENLIAKPPVVPDEKETQFEDEIEIAHLPLEDPAIGTHVHLTARGWRALVWSSSQLLVSSIIVTSS